MTEGIYITRARLHEMLTDAHIALVERRTEQAGAIIGALRKIMAPDATPAPFHAPTQAQEEAQPAHQQHLTVEPGSAADTASRSSTADVAPVAPAPSPAQAPKGRPIPQARARSSTPNTGRAGGVWTPQRDDMLRRMWAEGATAAEALAAINALPARHPVASTQAIYNRASYLRVERAPEVRAMMLTRNGKLGAEKARDLVARGEVTLGAKPVIWTEERRALAQRMWEAGEHAAAICEAVNRIEAPAPVQSSHAVRTQASRQGWQRPASFIEAKRARYAERMRRLHGTPQAPTPEPAPADEAPQAEAVTATPARVEIAPAAVLMEPDEPTPEQQAAIADAAVARKQERVRESLRDMLARKPKDEFLSAAQIATRHGMPVREVMRLLGEVRTERRAG